MLNRDTKNIVIVGAGLAGLVTVIECVNRAKNQNRNFNINIIEKRSLDFNRRQKIVLTLLNEFKYSQYPPTHWQDFCEKNFDPYGTIHQKFNQFKIDGLEINKPINHREKFLFKLWQQSHICPNPLRTMFVPKNFSIKELQLALFEHIQHLSYPNIQISWHQPAILKTINTQEHVVVVENLNSKNTTKINYDEIVIAEGSKGEVTAFVNQNLNSPFHFKRFNFPILYHGCARLKLKNSSPLVNLHQKSNNFVAQFHLAYPNTFSRQELLQKLQALGYQSTELPKLFVVDDNYYKFSQGKSELRLFVASEIPKSLFSITDIKKRKEAIIAWSKLIAALTYNISDEYFEFDAKGETAEQDINALGFSNELKFVETPVINLSRGKHIYLVGDAAMSNFYPLGFSSVIAATEASTVGELLSNYNPACEQYIKLCNYYRIFLGNFLEDCGKQLFNRDFKNEFIQQLGHPPQKRRIEI